MRVDTHMHLFATPEEGRAVVDGYPIVEYGALDTVRFSERAGTVSDGLGALAAAGADHACVLASCELPGVPFPPGGAREWPSEPPHADHAEALRASNAWLCDACAPHPELLPFVTISPGAMTAPGSAAHVADLADHRGARGVKLHTIALRLHPDDPALAPTLAVCADRGLPVVAHCGPDRHGAGWALPAAFAAAVDAHPSLQLVLAHLGGGAWRETAAFAAAHPAVRFDLSEIIAWAGAPAAPTPSELAALIKEIGPERVLLGSDFPWYEPADTIAQVLALPGLSAEQQAAVLGGNAARLLGLD